MVVSNLHALQAWQKFKAYSLSHGHFWDCFGTPLLSPSSYKFSGISSADCISALVLQQSTLHRTLYWRRSSLEGETAALGWLVLPRGPHLINGKHSLTLSFAPRRQCNFPLSLLQDPWLSQENTRHWCPMSSSFIPIRPSEQDYSNLSHYTSFRQ